MNNCQPEIIELPKICDHRGNLSVIENLKEVPFKIGNIRWIYGTPGGGKLNGYTNYCHDEMIVVISGSCDVITTDGTSEKSHHIDRAYLGLYIPANFYRSFINLSTNAVILIISSETKDTGKTPNGICHQTTTIKDCRTIPLLECNNQQNHSTEVDCTNLPYTAKRIYYLYDVPAGSKRGGHSHKECIEYLVAVSGSFDVIIDDGSAKRKFTLNRPNQGLLISTGIWRTLRNFSSGAICLVLASHEYDEKDYIRQYSNFLKSKNKLTLSK